MRIFSKNHAILLCKRLILLTIIAANDYQLLVLWDPFYISLIVLRSMLNVISLDHSIFAMV